MSTPDTELLIPVLDDVSEDDNAEASDADTDHFGLEEIGQEG